MENENKVGENFKIICPFCDAPYDAEMVLTLSADASRKPEDKEDWIRMVTTVEILCSKCGKIIYQQTKKKREVNWTQF